MVLDGLWIGIVHSFIGIEFSILVYLYITSITNGDKVKIDPTQISQPPRSQTVEEDTEAEQIGNSSEKIIHAIPN